MQDAHISVLKNTAMKPVKVVVRKADIGRSQQQI